MMVFGISILSLNLDSIKYLMIILFYPAFEKQNKKNLQD